MIPKVQDVCTAPVVCSDVVVVPAPQPELPELAIVQQRPGPAAPSPSDVAESAPHRRAVHGQTQVPLAFRARSLAYGAHLKRSPGWFAGYREVFDAFKKGGDEDKAAAGLKALVPRARDAMEIMDLSRASMHFSFTYNGGIRSEIAHEALPRARNVAELVALIDENRSYNPGDVINPQTRPPLYEPNVWARGRELATTASDALALAQASFKRNRWHEYFDPTFENLRHAATLARDAKDVKLMRAVLTLADSAAAKLASHWTPDGYEASKSRKQRDDVARIIEGRPAAHHEATG